MSKSRGFTFTLNNYTEEDIKNIKEFKCQYLFQEETGESGTKHLQGMLYFTNAVSFNTVRTMLPRAHIEKMKSKIASIKYCSKEDSRTGLIYSNWNYGGEVGTLAHCAEDEKPKRISIDGKIKNDKDYILIAMDLFVTNPELFEKLIDDDTKQHVRDTYAVDIGGLSAWHL